MSVEVAHFGVELGEGAHLGELGHLYNIGAGQVGGLATGDGGEHLLAQVGVGEGLDINSDVGVKLLEGGQDGVVECIHLRRHSVIGGPEGDCA